MTQLYSLLVLTEPLACGLSEDHAVGEAVPATDTTFSYFQVQAMTSSCHWCFGLIFKLTVFQRSFEMALLSFKCMFMCIFITVILCIMSQKKCHAIVLQKVKKKLESIILAQILVWTRFYPIPRHMHKRICTLILDHNIDVL